MIPNVAVLEIESRHFHIASRRWIPLIPSLDSAVPALACSSRQFCNPRLRLGIAGRRQFLARRRATFWGILSSLRGTDVRVTKHQSNVSVRIL